MKRSKNKEKNEIEAFIIDAEAFRKSVDMLSDYRKSLQCAHDDLSEIEEVPQEALDDLNEQIEVVDSLIANFRQSILKSIYGEGTGIPEYH